MPSISKSLLHSSKCLMGFERNPGQYLRVKNRLPSAESRGNLQCRCASLSPLNEKHFGLLKHLDLFFQEVGKMVGELNRGRSVWSWGLGELPTGFHTWCAQQTKRWATAKAAGHLSMVMRSTASVSALNETLRWDTRDLNRSHFRFRSDQSHSVWFGCKSSNQPKPTWENTAPIIWSTQDENKWVVLGSNSVRKKVTASARGVIFLDANVCAGLSFICLSVHALGVARRL